MSKERVIHRIKDSYNIVSKIDKKLIWLCFILAITIGVEPYIGTIMITLILDGLINEKSIEYIALLVITMVVLNLLIKLVTKYLNYIKENRLFVSEQHYRKMKTKKFMEVNYSILETTDFEDIRQGIRFSDESMSTFPALVDTFQNMFAQIFSIVIALGIFISLFISLLSKGSNPFYILFAFILLTVVVSILTLLTVNTQRKSEHKLSMLYNKINANNRLSMYIAETVVYNYNAGKDIRTYNMADFIGKEFDKVLHKAKPIMRDINRSNTFPGVIGSISSAIIGGLVYILVGIYASLGMLGISSVILYASSVRNLISCITTLIFQYGQLGIFMVRLFPSLELLKMPNECTIESSNEKNAISINDDDIKIVFDNISFKYPNSNEWALHNVSFEISSLKKTAIVGTNGAGKTTIVKLLCRFYEPTVGKIYINDVDISKIAIEEYRKLLAVIFQDFKLFSFTIGQNLSVSDMYDIDDAVSALTKVGFINRLDTLPLKLETPLYSDFDEKGIEVSGGEAQKIALARLLYRKSPIIILDEPTSALDPLAEAEVYEKMSSIIEEKMTIFISHRLSACKFCDNILVFDKGLLVQSGSHNHLVSDKDGLYYKLWQAQAQYYVK